MHCDQVQTLLASLPAHDTAALPMAIRQHTETCPRCRAFFIALQQIDYALACRPLPAVPGTLSRIVDERIRAHPHAHMEAPFSRTFCALSALVTLLALVGAAWLLQAGAMASDAMLSTPLAQTWLHPVWASNASSWLTVQSEQLAQIVLALMAGMLLAGAASAIGYRASHRGPRAETQDPNLPAVSPRL
ncbi:MAG: hypothetical protein ACUVX9_08010 [Anaerolineae bacterium]